MIKKSGESFDDESNRGYDSEPIPFDHLTLLHVATYYVSLECFILLENIGKLSLRLQSAAGYYPLHYACHNGSHKVALYILSKDPNQAHDHIEGIDNNQLLNFAVIGSDPEILQALFDKGAKKTD